MGPYLKGVVVDEVNAHFVSAPEPEATLILSGRRVPKRERET